MLFSESNAWGIGPGLTALLSSWPLLVSVCTSASGSLHLLRYNQVIMVLIFIHTHIDKSGKPLILVFSLHSVYYMWLFFNFLLLQLIVEEWLFEIVPFNLRRWSLLKHCVYLLTTGGRCSLRVFVSVHCFSHIPMGSERWEVCGWSILDIDLIHESLSLFYHPSIHVSNR